MAYLVAWLVYLVMAALLMFGFERYVAPLLRHRQLRVFCRSLLAIVLFTPGLAFGDDHYYLVPACIEVLFNLLAHSGEGIMKATLPLLLVAGIVFAVLFVREARGSDGEVGGGGGTGSPREEPTV
jgi:hypothetical protein